MEGIKIIDDSLKNSWKQKPENGNQIKMFLLNFFRNIDLYILYT